MAAVTSVAGTEKKATAANAATSPVDQDPITDFFGTEKVSGGLYSEKVLRGFQSPILHIFVLSNIEREERRATSARLRFLLAQGYAHLDTVGATPIQTELLKTNKDQMVNDIRERQILPRQQAAELATMYQQITAQCPSTHTVEKYLYEVRAKQMCLEWKVTDLEKQEERLAEDSFDNMLWMTRGAADPNTPSSAQTRTIDLLKVIAETEMRRVDFDLNREKIRAACASGLIAAEKKASDKHLGRNTVQSDVRASP